MAEENPLVPNELLRKLEALTRELRLGGRRRGGAKVGGHEAIRASVLLTLRAGDLICDLSGSDLGRTSSAGKDLVWLELPADAGVKRAWMLLGGALALRGQAASAAGGSEGAALLLVLVPAADLRRPDWRAVAELAAKQTAPLVLVAFPEQGRPVRLPKTPGLPGIPVDAVDAVALCRVIGESCLRARNGDGPALIQAVSWQRSPG